MEKLGIKVPKILFPKSKNFENWASIACDQYEKDRVFWDNLRNERKNTTSTLHLFLPEVYLEDAEMKEKLLKESVENTHKYIKEGVFETKEGFVFLERVLSDGKKRKGLILALDLEAYSFETGAEALIRPTEMTILSRIPPRVQIRESAVVELPHIMVLIDDPEKTVIEPLSEELKNKKPIYDFKIKIKGNETKLTGKMIEEKEIFDKIVKNLQKLADPKIQKEKYHLKEEKKPILFAMGDGNHSLATAKTHWENVKKTLKEEEKKNHPARYALVEIINLYDESINVFHPIHRILGNTGKKMPIKPENVLKKMEEFYKDEEGIVKMFPRKEGIKEIEKMKEKEGHTIGIYTKDKAGYLYVKNPKLVLEVATIQKFLDQYVKQLSKENSEYKIEELISFIHGDEELLELSETEGQMGFMLVEVDKSKFFKSVLEVGVCPRKTFSIGLAHDKRLYLECRKIVKSEKF